jgi:hypothetical protein
MVDENEFFRNATMRICGNLDFEEALFSILTFLRQTMPADRLLLQFFEESLTKSKKVPRSPTSPKL